MDCEFPYAVLTSRFIDYFNIDVSNEIVDFTRASNEITKRHLKKLDMTYVDHEWIMSGEQRAVANADLMEGEAQQKPTPQWNPFESLMI